MPEAPDPPPETADVVATCQRLFSEFARTTASRAPTYTQLSLSIASAPELAGLLLHAPPTQRQPVLLFACLHALVLDDPSMDLARWYRDVRPGADGGAEAGAADDPLPALRECCAVHGARLRALLARRSTQTNEIGRCALLLPVLTAVADEVGPLAHLDVGASAGLNLLLDRYQYRYRPGGTIGSPSPVVLDCDVRGDGPTPTALPPIARAVGLDRAPVDVADPDQARWLEACVWPDQLDRLERLRAAVTVARAAGVEVRRGDAVTDTPGTVRELARSGHPVVTNTWVLNYLTTADRVAYVGALDAVGAEVDLTWVYAETPALVEGIPRPRGDPTDRTVLSVVRWRGGRRQVQHLAECHPHGYWLHWY